MKQKTEHTDTRKQISVKIRNTHLHLWAWFGRRGERSHQDQRVSSSCSCVEGHRTTKPRNKGRNGLQKEKDRERRRRREDDRGRNVLVKAESTRSKNSNTVRIPYMCGNEISVCSVSRKTQQKTETVAPAFRHTLYLLNIWPAHGS